MSLAVSFRSELLKTRRTSSFYLCLLLAVLIPALYLFGILTSRDALKTLGQDPWNKHLSEGWKALSFLLLPVFVVLVCTLLPQIEYRNNTWKQVFSSPQSLMQIFLSKFLLIHCLILLILIVFNVLMIVALIIAGIALPSIHLFDHGIDWQLFLRSFTRMYVLALAISAFQFWLGLRIRNFIVPIGIGIGLWFAAGILGVELRWEYIDFYPHAFPMMHSSARFEKEIGEIQWRSAIYALLFLVLAFADLKWRKVKY